MTDWQEIGEQHGQSVCQTAFRLLDNHADASDCFQKVCLDAVKVDRREPIQHWSALLQRIATARSISIVQAYHILLQDIAWP